MSEKTFAPRDPSRFLERITISLPGYDMADGAIYGELYSSPTRRTGRRICVLSSKGTMLWDSGNCYDAANASNALEVWLLDKIEECCHCKTKTGGFLKSAQDAETGHPICDRCVQKTAEGKRDAWLPQATEVSISHEDLEISRKLLAGEKLNGREFYKSIIPVDKDEEHLESKIAPTVESDDCPF